MKQYRQNRTLQNNRRKIYQQVAGESFKCEGEPKQFGSKIWNIDIITEKKPNGLTTEEKICKDWTQAWRQNTPWFTQRITKVYRIRKRQTMLVYMDFGLKIHLHPQQTGYGNEQIFTRSRYTRMDDSGKDHPHPEWFQKRKCPK